ncbi:MAG: acetyl/propionyl/methylcrotonyl-CoA carboxylase subunit alpha [Betaproteobacteria bacterium]
MFDKILIANRGEIAVRVARTAKRLGIRTVAIYSEADAAALHVAACDEAYCIGPPPARESYLRADRIVEIAQRSGAQAVHPGYGFLSENADFAQRCGDAGLTFIGPSPSAIRAMGSKSAAKSIMDAAGVPLVPGYHGELQDLASLTREAERIGYPVLVKASAGGGGKGMRVVRSAGEFADALAGGKREAAASFSDDRVLLEKYLAHPRHIEIQIFADTHGNAVYLFERDCSIQRRHQKVLEEAPAPGMSTARRRQMGSTALAAARAVDYVNAGTVEFIADETGNFFFMEMNTRLQVEHPVTEMISGQDLVEWQLLVAAGQELPMTQEQLHINGHAVEARVYAEDPLRDFLPAAGRIIHLRSPAPSTHIRVDTGVQQGDEIGVNYDPMIAKLIAWDVDRASAVRRLHAALCEYQVVGVTTNLSFLANVTAHRAFAEADRNPVLLDTGLIERYRGELLPPPQPADQRMLAIAALSELLRSDQQANAMAKDSGDPGSPWNAADGWRLNQDSHHTIVFEDGEAEVSVTAHYRNGKVSLDLPGGHVDASVDALANGELIVDLGSDKVRATVVRNGRELTVFATGASHRLKLREYDAVEDEEAGGRLTAPMPGNVIEVLVREGETVVKGQALMIIEAMKMEHTIQAPSEGSIERIRFAKGDQVKEGDQLIVFAE